MQSNRFERTGTITLFAAIACLVGLSGCSDAWEHWWQNHRGDDDGASAPDSGSGSAQAGASAADSGSGPAQGDASAADSGNASTEACGNEGLPECPAGQFCNFPEAASCGEMDEPGTCAEIPQACARIYEPVCGCDGTTYGNECEAAANQVSVRTRGECAAEGTVCGGPDDVACADSEYCMYAEGANCGRTDETGLCTPKPSTCTLELNPMCGCDGNTYSNPCTAAAAGVSVETEGECPDAYCGGFAAVQCPEGEYCDLAAGQGCDVADGSGVCRPRPDACTQEFDPVCGCDNQTYGNACTAASAGVSIRSEGECPAP